MKGAKSAQANSIACSAIVGIGVDLELLVDRFYEKTAGKHINDPSAYLLRMAQDEARAIGGGAELSDDTILLACE